jgi:hypothetical protein
MKRLVPVAVMAAATLLLAAPAQPAAPTNKQLARQVKALQKEVKTLKKQVRETRNIALGTLVYTGCSIAVTTDAFQGTWTVIDQVASRPIFGPQVPVSDAPGLCAALEIQRAPTQVPPNVSVFDSLLRIFR